MTQADTGFEAEYGSFGGLSYEESVFDFGLLFPMAESWAAGDREILCIISDPARTIILGSLAGAGR